MKITKQISLLLVLLITAFSCDEADELTEFDITDDYTTTLNVSVSEDSDGMPVSFTQSGILDLASNQEIQDNINLIQDVTIDALTYTISNFSGIEGATITEASLNFGGTTISVADINLQDSDTNNTVYSVADASILNAIASSLENTSAITVTVTGTVNAAPVVFDVIVDLDVTVTIDVL